MDQKKNRAEKDLRDYFQFNDLILQIEKLKVRQTTHKNTRTQRHSYTYKLNLRAPKSVFFTFVSLKLNK